MLESLNLSISVEEMLSAAILALVITWIIKTLFIVKDLVKKMPKEFDYASKDLKAIMDKCYAMFPKEKIQFEGKTFNRGMHVRIMTIHKKTFEGELIGSNQNDMICIITQKYIIAHELTNIKEITILD